MRAPATGKARRPTVESLTAAKSRWSEDEDRSLCQDGVSATEVNCRRVIPSPRARLLLWNIQTIIGYLEEAGYQWGWDCRGADREVAARRALCRASRLLCSRCTCTDAGTGAAPHCRKRRRCRGPSDCPTSSAQSNDSCASGARCGGKPRRTPLCSKSWKTVIANLSFISRVLAYILRCIRGLAWHPYEYTILYWQNINGDNCCKQYYIICKTYTGWSKCTPTITTPSTRRSAQELTNILQGIVQRTAWDVITSTITLSKFSAECASEKKIENRFIFDI